MADKKHTAPEPVQEQGSKKAARREEKQAEKAAVRAETKARAADKKQAAAKRPTVKQMIAGISLAVIMLVGIVGSVQLGALAPTFNGDIDVAALAANPDDTSAYNMDAADGAAYVIVAKNNSMTTAGNVCFSVVFNFRGYDTMGESFILIAAIAGSLCILRPSRPVKPASKTRKEAAQ